MLLTLVTHDPSSKLLLLRGDNRVPPMPVRIATSHMTDCLKTTRPVDSRACVQASAVHVYQQTEATSCSKGLAPQHSLTLSCTTRCALGNKEQATCNLHGRQQAYRVAGKFDSLGRCIIKYPMQVRPVCSPLISIIPFKIYKITRCKTHKYN